MGIKHYHLLISGRVQGVSYRFNAWQQAKQLELTGWVRNLPDGRVEMYIEGDADRLDNMIKWAQTGPRFATVTDMAINEKTSRNEYSDFQIR